MVRITLVVGDGVTGTAPVSVAAEGRGVGLAVGAT